MRAQRGLRALLAHVLLGRLDATGTSTEHTTCPVGRSSSGRPLRHVGRLADAPQVSSDAPSSPWKKARTASRDRFAETKPLPSYLIAFAVGPFGYVDAGKVGKAPVRIVVPRGKEPWARFAVESTKPVLERLESYFGSPYPYEKLDLIAVPMFGGAMENPGLVTYRQSLILSKPRMESTGFRRAFASVNTHELAHQRVRRHHLSKGRGRHCHVRALGRTRGLPKGRAALSS
jgi:hypothetical protein